MSDPKEAAYWKAKWKETQAQLAALRAEKAMKPKRKPKKY